MSTHETALALVRDAFKESPRAAEQQLGLIGHNQGDDALALITRQLAPAEVFALAMDADATKSSIAQAFVSADQLREAFSFFGSRYKGPTPDVSRDLVDFLHPFFFDGSLEHRESMVAGFLKHDLSMKSLCALCIGAPGFVEFFSRNHGLGSTGAEGWQEIILFVREVNPRAFDRVRDRALEMVTGDVEDLERAGVFCDRVCNELISEAKRITGSDEVKGEKPATEFLPI